jgi:hypothetical protein
MSDFNRGPRDLMFFFSGHTRAMGPVSLPDNRGDAAVRQKDGTRCG